MAPKSKNSGMLPMSGVMVNRRDGPLGLGNSDDDDDDDDDDDEGSNKQVYCTASSLLIL